MAKESELRCGWMKMIGMKEDLDKEEREERVAKFAKSSSQFIHEL